ncbi:hypothetical protein QQF64_014322 [Cirrhinus molitorella]|uniref:Protein kinase domain-containing protein n=1 Tax=Cirrhinus molitorella TaxID=172907 RepID=A0ABR3NRR2_9TELE
MFPLGALVSPQSRNIQPSLRPFVGIKSFEEIQQMEIEPVTGGRREVQVPISVKGRIILEILEGMVYLMENQVIHKDLKPENILVDKNFHIKIADLGLATSQMWSKLTKEESRRQSRLGKKSCFPTAGTLCYMAPEHLKSINTRSTEKSDIYSFAIVVWVILTGREPYENARSEEHICHCVCQVNVPTKR